MKGKIKKKNIESFIQDIEDFEGFEKGKWELEQHLTPPDMASQFLLSIYEREENLDSYAVADLGCGTGMLINGMLYIGAQGGIGLEIDEKYAEKAKESLQEKFGQEAWYDLILADVTKYALPTKSRPFDMVFMNPPFGTKNNEGIDTQFLLKADQLTDGNIYSLHKSSTRQYLEKKAGEMSRGFEVISSIKYPLPKKFAKYHKLNVAFTEVDFICFSSK